MRLFNKRPTYGTVYFMQSTSDHGLIKVGITRRKLKDRRQEINSATKQKFKIVYSVRCYHHYYVEQEILKCLRRNWNIRSAKSYGTEYFIYKGDAARIVKYFEKSYYKVERKARWHFSRPKDYFTKTKIFNPRKI